MTFDPFQAVLSLHQSGRITEAEAGYHALLEKHPEDPQIHNMLGNCLADQSRWEAAAASYRRAIALSPDRAAPHYNLGNALSALDSPREAIQAYQQAIALRPDYAKAHFNLGNLLFDGGQYAQAAGCYRSALDADPEHPDPEALFNLARALHRQGKPALAIPFYQRALQRDPSCHPAYGALALAWLETGKTKQALKCHQQALQQEPDDPAVHFYYGRTLLMLLQFEEAEAAFRRTLELAPQSNDAYRALGHIMDTQGRREELARLAEAWLEAQPHDPEASHYHQAWTGNASPARASDDFVRATFDGFADDFDEVLQTLDYRAPQLLQTALANQLNEEAPERAVLDAGCGTGWCGSFLRGWAKRLVGVDLSPGMLARARRRGVYDALIESELTAYLHDVPARFDLIVSSDTLIYFGDLAPVLRASAAALRDGGYLAMTLERLCDDALPAGYQLEAHGRFSHTTSYVRHQITAAGLQIVSWEEAPLRREGGTDVTGLVVVAQKPAGGA